MEFYIGWEPALLLWTSILITCGISIGSIILGFFYGLIFGLIKGDKYSIKSGVIFLLIINFILLIGLFLVQAINFTQTNRFLSPLNIWSIHNTAFYIGTLFLSFIVAVTLGAMALLFISAIISLAHKLTSKTIADKKSRKAKK
jgi:hypothetical protein